MVINYMETMHTTNKKSYEEYMQALEEERRKIQVFHRELPLCLDLVNQAIENCKQQVYSCERSECEENEEETSSEGGPVLEEFIPIKRSLSSSQEEKSDEHKSNESNGTKVDWLRSVQLWNQNPSSPSKEVIHNSQENSEKVIGVKENGGAFHPFHKSKVVKPMVKAVKEAEVGTNITMTIQNSVPAASTSSTADNSHKKKEDKEGLNRKTRRCWSPELHRDFLQALQQLGGSHAATPKQIRELMKVDGLTNDEVKSHLQKYRLHTRRPGPSIHSNCNNQPTQFVVVGGIWVPPQEYSGVTATKSDRTSNVPERIYVPVAAPPQVNLPSCQGQQQQRLQLSTGSSHSERKSSHTEHSIEDDNAHSVSPVAASSSTDTTTASPNC
ncbi:hypothetical protein IFM89_011591 [Coptis chinensis]|uniref:HTH myb-type domain-containing protein n=1 Tax=Coptis chinensis TaxID=261450 RepID=A0A835H5K0_9MAGN|nr:hypothetical protein IFM89_011591 [Coptis chinensis]